MKLFDHFRIIAPAYDWVFRYDEAMSPRHLLQMPADGWLVDVGGGTGRVAETLRDLTPRLIVLDESGGMLRQAKGKRFLAVMAAVEALPFRSETIERFLMVDAFHHLRDQGKSVLEVLRTLTPSGRLVMQEPDIKHRGVRWIALMEKLLLMRSRFVPPDAVQRLFTEAGAQVELLHTKPHFTLIAEKDVIT